MKCFRSSRGSQISWTLTRQPISAEDVKHGLNDQSILLQTSGLPESGHKSLEIPRHHRSFGSNVTFENRRSGMKRVGTALTELSTQHSTGEGGGTEDTETENADVSLNFASRSSLRESALNCNICLCYTQDEF